MEAIEKRYYHIPLLDAEARGEAKGKVKGSDERAFVIALKMLKRGKSIEEVTEFTDLSREQIENLQKSLGHDVA